MGTVNHSSLEMKKKAEIIIEIDEEAGDRAPARFEAFCPECRRLVALAAPAAAAVARGISERRIFRLLERGSIHFVETDRVLVCLDSLAAFERGPAAGEKDTEPDFDAAKCGTGGP